MPQGGKGRKQKNFWMDPADDDLLRLVCQIGNMDQQDFISTAIDTAIWAAVSDPGFKEKLRKHRALLNQLKADGEDGPTT